MLNINVLFKGYFMTFLASFYLWLLPLISIPIIFHLLKKRNYKNINFSSLLFFNIIEDSALKKNNLINILLLIIRTLILLLIILIISKPTIEGLSRNKEKSSNDICIIAIDNSFSNSVEITQIYDKVLKKIIDGYNENTLIQITNMSNNKYLINDYKKNIQNFKLDKEILYKTSSLENLSIFFKDKIFSNYNNRDFYLISDMQENIFNDNLDFIDKTWNKFLYKTKPYNGIYFSSISINPNFITIDQQITVSIKLHNNTKSKIDNREILLFVNDANVGVNTTSLSSFETELYTFKTSINSYGKHKCYFQFEDIKHYFVIDIPPKVNIAIIDEDRNSKYLSNALQAFNDISKNINYTIFSIDQYKLVNDTYDSIILFGLDYLDTITLNKISQQTNNAIIIPTNTFDLKNINSFFGLETATSIKSLSTIKSGYINVNNSITSDNALKAVLQNEKIDIYKYFKVNKNENTICEYENNNAFINRYLNENLTLTLLTSPLDISSNNLPLTSIFMPFVNHIIIQNSKKINLEVGDSIDPSNYSSSINLEFIESGITSNFKVSNIRNQDLTISKVGFHQIISDNSSSIIAANIPFVEYSDDIINDIKLDKYLNGAIMINSIDQLSSLLSIQINGFHLWRYFLWLLTLLIIIEMIISNIYVYKND